MVAIFLWHQHQGVKDSDKVFSVHCLFYSHCGKSRCHRVLPHTARDGTVAFQHTLINTKQNSPLSAGVWLCRSVSLFCLSPSKCLCLCPDSSASLSRVSLLCSQFWVCLSVLPSEPEDQSADSSHPRWLIPCEGALPSTSTYISSDSTTFSQGEDKWVFSDQYLLQDSLRHTVSFLGEVNFVR